MALTLCNANYDLTADNVDVLYIGLAYGYTGTVRAGATTNWTAQPSVDWLQQFANGTNIKNADCDGNGTINATDTVAVSLNYGLTHLIPSPQYYKPQNFGTDLYFDMPTASLIPGSVVNIPIMFGTSTSPANNVYGIAFTINYDAALIQPNSVDVDFTNSWLGNVSNTIHLIRDFAVSGSCDVGFVKTDHLNTSGYGTIATLSFTVAANASGYLNLSFSGIFIIDKNEIPIPVNAISGTVYTFINENPSLENLIQIYPNPTTSQISITDREKIIQKVTLLDVTGQQLLSNQNSGKKLTMDVNSIANGIYFLNIESSKGILNRKIMIER